MIKIGFNREIKLRSESQKKRTIGFTTKNNKFKLEGAPELTSLSVQITKQMKKDLKYLVEVEKKYPSLSEAIRAAARDLLKQEKRWNK